MPYTINKTNGGQVTVVADGSTDSTLDIKLIGKNFAGYGEVQNENFVYLLENFANSSPPSKPIAGQMWFDSSNSKLKFYDGSKFRTTGGAEIGTIQPTGLTEGDFFFNSDTKQLFAWSLTGSASGTAPGFVLVGPEAVSGQGITQMKSRSVNGRPVGNPSGALATHPIIEAVVGDDTIFVISTDADFDLDSTNTITGFTTIRQGVTLCYTTNGSLLGQTTSSHRLWGTASNSERLGGYTASDYSRSSNASFTSLVNFADVGFTVGTTPRLKVFNESASTPTIQNQLSDTIVFQTTVASATKTPMKLVGTNILPGADLVSDIGSLTAGAGSTALKFNNVYARYFKGQADEAVALMVSSVARTAAVASSNDTIVVRTSTGQINASQFNGLATSANYADLAEKYLTDAEYAVGTVVSVGGEKEVTACNWSQRVIGVVSENPAFKMNSELESGTYIALTGRVPVRVIGRINKGDELIAANNGCAMMAGTAPAGRVFAVALESSDDESIKLIECVVF
jgi:hypothetical protein